ncbi:MAG TPA: hypothetical protein VFF28_05080 [Candidatus Nanoarchaeia archaeon]|nr:hypothetical protein [Candidatus Nanoarchaeia archaeon]
MIDRPKIRKLGRIANRLNSCAAAKKSLQSKIDSMKADEKDGKISKKELDNYLDERIKGMSRLEPVKFLDKYSKQKSRLLVQKKASVKKAAPVFAGVAVALLLLYLLPLEKTGYGVVEKNLAIPITVDSRYSMPFDGIIHSLRLDGQMSSQGLLKIYLNGTNSSYLVLDSSMLDIRAVSDTTSILAEGDLNLTLVRNNTGSIYDFYTDSFGSEHLCALWQVGEESLCYGPTDCCSFAGHESIGPYDEHVYLSYGRYGAGEENTVGVQIIFANYSIGENPYSDVRYSEVAQAEANFAKTFKGACIETCSLPGFEASNLVFEAENSSVTIDSIRYSEEVPGNAPILLNDIENLTIYTGEYANIDLSKYFDDDSELTYSASSDAAVITNSSALIVSNFTGKKYLYFTASDGIYSTVSNLVEIKATEKPIPASDANITEQLITPKIRINAPVRWVTIINASSLAVNITINISADAFDLSVSSSKERLSQVTIKDGGEAKNISSYNAQKRLDVIEAEEEKLSERKDWIIANTPLAKDEISAVNEELLKLSNERNKLTGYAVVSGRGLFTRFFERLLDVDITGYAVKDKKDKNKSKEIEVVIEEPVSSAVVQYYTEAPTSTETLLSSTSKQIIISSDVHYENITAYTNVSPETASHKLKLYRIVNSSREAASFDRYDNNNNSLTDYIEWVVPSLSNQTYELVIEISKAEHLDSNYGFVEDVYDHVKAQDGNWTLINSSHYLRVTFEQNLTSDRDITIYAKDPRIVNGSVLLNGTLVPLDVYQKKMRIDEIRRMLANG